LRENTWHQFLLEWQKSMKGVILAAGKSTRLLPLTGEVPKSMARLRASP
jgi:choline kinase